MTGVPAEVGISIPNVNLGQRISGSYTEAPRVFGHRQTPEFGAKSGGMVRLYPVQASGYRQTLIHGRGPICDGRVSTSATSRCLRTSRWGLTTIADWQLRLEMFNAFNHPQFDNMNTGSLSTFVATSRRRETKAANITCGDYRAFQQAAATSVRNIPWGC